MAYKIKYRYRYQIMTLGCLCPSGCEEQQVILAGVSHGEY